MDMTNHVADMVEGHFRTIEQSQYAQLEIENQKLLKVVDDQTLQLEAALIRIKELEDLMMEYEREGND